MRSVCADSPSSSFALARSCCFDFYDRSLSFPLFQVRWLSSSVLTKKLRLVTEQALRGHVEYLRRMEGPPLPRAPPLEASSSSSLMSGDGDTKNGETGPGLLGASALRSALTAVSDPAVSLRECEAQLLPQECWIRREFLLASASPSALPSRELSLFSGSGSLQLAGELKSVFLEGFGELRVLHEDLLGGEGLRAEEVDGVLVPMPRNMLPYRGFGEEAK